MRRRAAHAAPRDDRAHRRRPPRRRHGSAQRQRRRLLRHPGFVVDPAVRVEDWGRLLPTLTEVLRRRVGRLSACRSVN
ncbi:hypothetical protein FRIGORI9N_90036 [Frigoribacterium sp. 9N]|nr:hypothetical protein FRIGORI9N_90036 [Frigoribacterium sp. 9N]